MNVLQALAFVAGILLVVGGGHYLRLSPTADEFLDDLREIHYLIFGIFIGLLLVLAIRRRRKRGRG